MKVNQERNDQWDELDYQFTSKQLDFFGLSPTSRSWSRVPLVVMMSF